MSNKPIRVLIGVSLEESDMPMEFYIFDEGVTFGGNNMTMTDLEIANAVLLDLADALQKKMKLMVN